MYLMIRVEGNDEPCSLCLVQAKTAEKAKEIVGIPEHSTQWTFVANELLTGLTDIKEGYIVKQL